jgi:hypothetical protein
MISKYEDITYDEEYYELPTGEDDIEQVIWFVN